jgi:hypothetical protein
MLFDQDGPRAERVCRGSRGEQINRIEFPRHVRPLRRAGAVWDELNYIAR